MGSRLIQRLLDAQHPLGALGRLGRRGVPTQEHRCQRGGAGLGQGAVVERDLQPRVPHPGAQVLAMQRRQPPADVQPQPEQRGELGVGQVGVEVAGDVEERLLDDVRRVEPGPQPRVQPQLDHPPEPLAILVEERRQRLAVAAAEPLDRVSRFAGRLVHGGPHTLYPRTGEKAGPRNRLVDLTRRIGPNRSARIRKNRKWQRRPDGRCLSEEDPTGNLPTL